MENVLQKLEDAKTIGITGHIRPDGDCLGSTMALYNYIIDNYKDKSVSVHLESVPECFEYLPGADIIDTNYIDVDKYDVFVCLDSGDLDRIGNSLKYFEKASNTIAIDHHVSNIGYATYNHIIPDASATCEVLFELLEYDKISYNTAVCLYTGLIHDTGVFKHSCTSEKTMYVAGKLIAKGIPFSKIIDESFYEKTYMQNQILGESLNTAVIKLEGKSILSVIDKKTMEQYGAVSSDLDGIIDQLRVTKGIEVAVLLHEKEDNIYKVSMRANGDVNVSEIAKFFGGGGHVKAAGCTIQGQKDEVVDKLYEQIVLQMKS